MSFMQQGLKYTFLIKEYLFYNWNKAEASEPECPCCTKLRSVTCHTNATSLYSHSFYCDSFHFLLS